MHCWLASMWRRCRCRWSACRYSTWPRWRESSSWVRFDTSSCCGRWRRWRTSSRARPGCPAGRFLRHRPLPLLARWRCYRRGHNFSSQDSRSRSSMNRSRIYILAALQHYWSHWSWRSAFRTAARRVTRCSRGWCQQGCANSCSPRLFRHSLCWLLSYTHCPVWVSQRKSYRRIYLRM